MYSTNEYFHIQRTVKPTEQAVAPKNVNLLKAKEVPKLQNQRKPKQQLPKADKPVAVKEQKPNRSSSTVKPEQKELLQFKNVVLSLSILL